MLCLSGSQLKLEFKSKTVFPNSQLKAIKIRKNQIFFNYYCKKCDNTSDKMKWYIVGLNHNELACLQCCWCENIGFTPLKLSNATRGENISFYLYEIV